MRKKAIDLDLNEITGLNGLNDSAAEFYNSMDHLIENPRGFVDYVKGRRAQQFADFKSKHNWDR